MSQSNFFIPLLPYLEEQDLTFTIKQTSDDQLTVIVLPVLKADDKKAQGKLIPLTVKGTPTELDCDFLKAIKPAMEKVSGLAINLSAFEKAAEEAKKASKKAETEKKNRKDALENADKELKKVDEYIEKKEFEKADNAINAVLKLTPESRKAKTARKKLDKFWTKPTEMFSELIPEKVEEKPKEEKVEAKAETPPTPTKLVSDSNIVAEEKPEENKPSDFEKAIEETVEESKSANPAENIPIVNLEAQVDPPPVINQEPEPIQEPEINQPAEPEPQQEAVSFTQAPIDTNEVNPLDLL